MNANKTTYYYQLFNHKNGRVYPGDKHEYYFPEIRIFLEKKGEYSKHYPNGGLSFIGEDLFRITSQTQKNIGSKICNSYPYGNKVEWITDNYQTEETLKALKQIKYPTFLGVLKWAVEKKAIRLAYDDTNYCYIPYKFRNKKQVYYDAIKNGIIKPGCCAAIMQC